jgi:hypothetical protein
MEALIAFLLSEQGLAIVFGTAAYLMRKWASKDAAETVERLAPLAVEAAEQMKATKGFDNEKAKAHAVNSLLSAIPIEQRLLIPIAIGKMVDFGIEGSLKAGKNLKKKLDLANLTGS